jgi:sulfite reductase alpha subunit-like flavoprotein
LDIGYFLRYIGEVVGRKYSVARVREGRVYLMVKLVELEITETRWFRGLCSYDVSRVGVRRRARVVKGDITPEEMRGSNVMVTLGTGLAPFVWMLDRLSNQEEGSKKA